MPLNVGLSADLRRARLQLQGGEHNQQQAEEPPGMKQQARIPLKWRILLNYEQAFISCSCL